MGVTMAKRLAEDQILEAHETLRAYGGNKSKAAAHLGLGRSTFANRLRHASPEVHQGTQDAIDKPEEVKVHQLDGMVYVEGPYDLDPSIYQVDPSRSWIRRREATHAVEGGVVLIPKVEMRIAFKRLVDKATEDVMRELIRRLPAARPKKVRSAPSGVNMACWGLYDAHIGMRSWAPETGSDYDVSIATNTCMTLIDRVCTETDRRKVSRVIMPIGNDLLHVDNIHGTTTGKSANSGTHVDADGRYHMITASAVEVADHEERWREVENVVFHRGPCPHKFIRAADVLLGFSHGDGMAKADRRAAFLPIMASDLWSGAKTREAYFGHLHHERVDDYGVVFRQCPAIAPTSTYESKLGLIGATRAVAVNLYDDRRHRGEWKEYADEAA